MWHLQRVLWALCFPTDILSLWLQGCKLKGLCSGGWGKKLECFTQGPAHQRWVQRYCLSCTEATLW